MKPGEYDFDAIVVGSGPNGLAAAILMRQHGLSVLLLEANAEIGGGTRSAELTLPGFIHDVCSAVHPLGASSPFFKTLPLETYGLKYIYPPTAAAHPFDDGTAAVLLTSTEETARFLGADEHAYLDLMRPLVNDWPLIAPTILGPLQFPEHPLAMARFGLKALRSATSLAQRFKTKEAKALFAGMAGHSMQPLTNLTTSAIALVLLITGHTRGWPVVKGGSGQIAKALADHFIGLGGKIESNFEVRSLKQLPSSKTVLLDVGPRQLLQIAGHKFSSFYKWQLERYHYGPGVFKVDWALAAPVPFKAKACLGAGTVHIGNTMDEIVAAERQTCRGRYPEKPFVLFAQPSLFDSSRAPGGKHTAWAYCHVPNGSQNDMTEAIENQVERFAPGFRDTILARHTFNSMQLQEYNSNYIGGDINGGAMNIGQLFTRPALRWSPYRTSAKGIYICSASTPPGGGVHGMCGYHAAKRALKDVFGII